MFPVNPDVFQRNPAGELPLPQGRKRAGKTNGIVFQRTLQSPASGGPRVQMRGELRQWFDARIGNSGAREMRVIQGDAQSRHAPRQIQGAFRAVMSHRTTLVIAHRLSTVIDADEIVVLHDGTIVERGTHASLLAHDGLYAEMWALQADEPTPIAA